MEKLPKSEYSPEFREQAVRTYQESGLSVAEVAKRLSIPKSSLNNWVMAAKKGKLASVGKNQKPATEYDSITTDLMANGTYRTDARHRRATMNMLRNWGRLGFDVGYKAA